MLNRARRLSSRLGRQLGGCSRRNVDRVRHLVKQRKNIRPMLNNRVYKSYLGRHFTKQVFRIKEIKNPRILVKGKLQEQSRPPRYFLNGRWFPRDQLLVVPGTDGETQKLIDARPKR